MTAKVRVDPLLHNVPIVDVTGRPTPQFMRQWQQTRGVDTAVGGLETGLEAHAAATTDVHGISDTGNLILEGDARLANARTPLPHAASHYAGPDALALASLTGDLPLARVTGAVGTTDLRLSDARTPLPHAASHYSGPDALSLASIPGTLGLSQFAQGSTGQVLLAATGAASAYGQITNAHVASAAALAWTKLSKTGSSLADLTTRSATDLATGTLDDLRLSANVPLKNFANVFTAAQVVDRPVGTNNTIIFRVGGLDKYFVRADGRWRWAFTAGGAVTSEFEEVASGKLGMITGTHMRIPALEISTTEVITAGRNFQNIVRLALGSTGLWGSGTGSMIYIGAATAGPTTAIASGFNVWVDPVSGAMKARGKNGTITVLANP